MKRVIFVIAVVLSLTMRATAQVGPITLQVGFWNTIDMFMSEKDRSYAFSVTSYAPITMYHESVGTVQNISTNIDCQ